MATARRGRGAKCAIVARGAAGAARVVVGPVVWGRLLIGGSADRARAAAECHVCHRRRQGHGRRGIRSGDDFYAVSFSTQRAIFAEISGRSRFGEDFGHCVSGARPTRFLLTSRRRPSGHCCCCCCCCCEQSCAKNGGHRNGIWWLHPGNVELRMLQLLEYLLFYVECALENFVWTLKVLFWQFILSAELRGYD